MPGSGCQGHSQPGDGECKTPPRPLSPGSTLTEGGYEPSQVSSATTSAVRVAEAV